MVRTASAVFLGAALLAAAACGGGDDDTSSEDDAPVDADVEDDGGEDADGVDDGEGGDGADDGEGGDDVDGAAGAEFPVDGPVVTVLDFGLGVYAIDRADGEAVALTFPGDDEDNAWFADRQRQPFVAGDVAYALFQREVADVEFVNEFALGALDLTTGTASLVAEFGPSAESAESAERSSWELHGAGGGVAWLTRVDTGDTTTSTLLGVDLATGETVSEATDVEFELTTGSGGTCTFGLRPIAVDPNGTLIVDLGGIPAEWDPDAAAPVEIVPVCSDEVPGLADVAADPAAFVRTPDGSPLAPDAAERILDADIDAAATDGMLVTDEAIWWVFGGVRSYLPPDGEQVDAVVGGVARLDRASGEIEVVPVGDLIGGFVEQSESGGRTTTFLRGAFTEAGGSIWLMDTRDNGPLIRIDPASGAVETTEIPLDPVGVAPDADAGDGPRGTTGVGSRYTTAELLRTDPDGVWLTVTRWTITSDDDDGTSASGPSYVDQIDPATGEVVRSIPESDLTGVSF